MFALHKTRSQEFSALVVGCSEGGRSRQKLFLLVGDAGVIKPHECAGSSVSQLFLRRKTRVVADVDEPGGTMASTGWAWL